MLAITFVLFLLGLGLIANGVDKLQKNKTRTKKIILSVILIIVGIVLIGLVFTVWCNAYPLKP